MALLVLWNLVYQAPLVTLTVIAAIGKTERIVRRMADWFAARRRPLQSALAVVRVIALVVLSDGVLSLVGGHVPWLRQLLLRCAEHLPAHALSAVHTHWCRSDAASPSRMRK